MISPVNSASEAQASAAVQASPARQPARTPASPAQVTDTVQLSSTAKIVQEAIETPAQTAKEAASGDRQAKALLARETTAHASEK